MHYKRVYSSLNNRKIMGMIFLDISKAFNCINHERLYKKLEYIGVSERCIYIKWFKSYLKRTQMVRVTDKLSTPTDILSGIAQGTILGPLIFIFYINDVIHSIMHCHISLFADDCVLYLDGNNWNRIFDKIQQDVLAFQEWCSLNGLKVNPSKSQAMIVENSSKITKLDFERSFISNNNVIQYVKQFTYLGIILDNTMSLRPLHCNIRKKVNDKIFLLRKIRRYILISILLC